MFEFDPVLVNQWLSKSARRVPDKEAIVTDRERMTYRQIDQRSSYLAKVLLGMNLSAQDRVVVFLDDSVKTVISIYGTLKAGGAFVVLEGSVKSGKLGYILKNSCASVLITDTSKSPAVCEAFDEETGHCKIIWTGPEKKIPGNLSDISYSWQECFAGFSEQHFEAESVSLPEVIDTDLACLIYTSGSTGEPKGVVSTHHNMVSAAKSIIQYIGNNHDDIILNVLPLSFDYGLYQVIMAFMFGGTVVENKSLIYMNTILKTIEREQVTGFPIVPTIAAMLLRREDLHKYDFNSLRYLTNTGAALPVDHILGLREIFVGAKLYSMFGLTECKRVGYLPPEELERRPGSVGKAMPNCRVHVVDDEGCEVEAGEIGELVIKGSNVMQGYWMSPDLTEKTYRRGRYHHERLLHSGDYFRKDEDGYLYFMGRKDDMIKSKGERISPKEVENTITGFEGVAEAAVIGVPDEILGQAVKAFIVLCGKKRLSEKKLFKMCSENLETFAVPKYIEILDSLPKTPNGKVDKKALKNMCSCSPIGT